MRDCVCLVQKFGYMCFWELLTHWFKTEGRKEEKGDLPPEADQTCTSKQCIYGDYHIQGIRPGA